MGFIDEPTKKNFKKSHYEKFVEKEQDLLKKELVLYYKPHCPYCIKVIDFMKKNHIEFQLKDTQNEKNNEELIKAGGKKQVPCLFINEAPLYESSDIITWLSQNKNKF